MSKKEIIETGVCLCKETIEKEKPYNDGEVLVLVVCKNCDMLRKSFVRKAVKK